MPTHPPFFALPNDSADFVTGPFFSDVFIIYFRYLFCFWVLCRTLRWLSVSFWVHENIIYRIVSYQSNHQKWPARDGNTNVRDLT